MKTYNVYIMSNISKMLYTGVTNSLDTRIFQHKSKQTDGFTKKYNLNRLVYFEAFGDIRDAIAREKEIKGWRREKKNKLVESMNATWKDLAANLFPETLLFHGKPLHPANQEHKVPRR